MSEKMISRRNFFMLISAFTAMSMTRFSTARDRATTDIRKIEVNGLVFDVTIAGPEKGRPVLLLHGFPQSAQTWSAVSEVLVRHGFRTIAPDQRGYSKGARPTDVSAYTFEAFKSDALGIADALNLSRFDLSGFGMGAALSWMIAATQPNRVRSLTALRFPHPAAFAKAVREDPEQQQAWQKIKNKMNIDTLPTVEARAAAQLENDAAPFRRFLLDSGLPAAITEKYVKRLQEPGALAGALSWHQAISLDEFAGVPVVTVPTLFVWSEGPALTARTAKATANYVNAEYEERFLQDVGHFFLETAPLEIAPLLLDQFNRTK